MNPYTEAKSLKAETEVHNALNELPKGTVLETVLDLGCGNGQKTFPLVSWGVKNVYGVDSSEPMLLSAKLANKDKTVRFRKADFASVPFKDHKFDLITMWNAFHFSNLDTLMPELNRLVKLGGLILIREPGPKSKYGFGIDPVKQKRKALETSSAKTKLKKYKNIEFVKFKEFKDGNGYLAIFKFL